MQAVQLPGPAVLRHNLHSLLEVVCRQPALHHLRRLIIRYVRLKI